MSSAVEVEGLRVELTGSGDDIVDGVSFTIAAGEILGLVGESGSGKTTIALALLGGARHGARIVAGQVRVDGRDLLRLDRRGLREARGKIVAYVPQDPSAALNPALQIGTQLREVLEEHGEAGTTAAARERIARVLGEVRLPSSDEFLRRFPHQLSGGQQQRVWLAMAFILRPRLIVLDEPTTGLDVTTQAHVLETVNMLCRAHGAAALYVTHDLAVVANLADRVLVMYAGRLAELGTRDVVFAHPVHPYTRGLIAANPEIARRRLLVAIPGTAPAPGKRPAGCYFAPRCPSAGASCADVEPPVVALEAGHVARCHYAREIAASDRSAAGAEWRGGRGRGAPVLTVSRLDAYYGAKQALFGIELALHETECLALVGESGSGKTTVARSIIGLVTRRTGEIRYRGELLERGARRRPAVTRQEIQYVFQSPYNSLNPRRTIGDSISVPLRQFSRASRRDSRRQVAELLARVALPRDLIDRYPDQLSGGERQRVAIARALACGPRVLICDEITSALDVSVQATIIDLLQGLRESEQLSMLFITHNLALVRSIADRVIVMKDGRVVESGEADDVIDRSREDYTLELLRNTPSIPLAAAHPAR